MISAATVNTKTLVYGAVAVDAANKKRACGSRVEASRTKQNACGSRGRLNEEREVLAAKGGGKTEPCAHPLAFG